MKYVILYFKSYCILRYLDILLDDPILRKWIIITRKRSVDGLDFKNGDIPLKRRDKRGTYRWRESSWHLISGRMFHYPHISDADDILIRGRSAATRRDEEKRKERLIPWWSSWFRDYRDFQEVPNAAATPPSLLSKLRSSVSLRPVYNFHTDRHFTRPREFAVR